MIYIYIYILVMCGIRLDSITSEMYNIDFQWSQSDFSYNKFNYLFFSASVNRQRKTQL